MWIERPALRAPNFGGMRNGYVLATEPVSAFRANALCQNDTMSQPTINTAFSRRVEQINRGDPAEGNVCNVNLCQADSAADRDDYNL